MSNRIVRLIITADSAGAIKAMRDTEVAADSFGTRAKALGTGVTSVGRSLSMLSLPLLAVGGYATDSAVKFQSSMKLIQTQTRASAAEVATQSKNILKLSGQVGASPLELSEGLYPIESVGKRGAAAYHSLKAAAVGAAVGHDTLEATANAVAAAMKNQLKGVGSASEAMGQLDAIVGHGKMRLEELTEAMKTGVMATAQNLGISLKSLGAALDVMTSRGVPASSAATRLRTDLVRMVAPAQEAIKAMKEIGLGQYTLAEDLRKHNGLQLAVSTLRDHLKGLAKPIQSQLLSEMFGKSKGASTMMELTASLPEMQKLMPKLQSHLHENFMHTQETSALKLAQMLAKLKAAMVELGDVLMPVVIPAIIKLAGAFGGLVHFLTKLPGPLKTLVLVFVGVLAVAGPVLVVVGKLITAVGVLANAFKAVSAVIDFSAALDPAFLVLVALGVVVLLVATHFNTFKTVVKAVFSWLVGAVHTTINFVKAHWPLLLGILTGPFGLMVAYIATHLTEVKKIFMTIFNGIAGFVKSIFDSIVNGVIRSIDLVIKAIDLVIKGYNDIPGFLRPTGAIKVVGQIKEIGGTSTTQRVVHALAGTPALAGHPGGGAYASAQPLRINNQISIGRRQFGRPAAESVTEYALRRKAREG